MAGWGSCAYPVYQVMTVVERKEGKKKKKKKGRKKKDEDASTPHFCLCWKHKEKGSFRDVCPKGRPQGERKRERLILPQGDCVLQGGEFTVKSEKVGHFYEEEAISADGIGCLFDL